MQCQYCGFENLPGITECVDCHRPVIRIIPEFAIRPRRHPIRRHIDKIIFSIRTFFNRVGSDRTALYYAETVPIESSLLLRFRYLLNPQLNRPIWYQNPWLAGILSILPGLGQIYKGELIKGLLCFLFWFTTFAMIFYLFGKYVWVSLAVSMVISVHAIIILDAIINRILLLQRPQILCWNIALLLLVMGFYCVIIFPNIIPIAVQQNESRDILQGDRLISISWIYGFGQPQSGDIVYYRYPQINPTGHGTYIPSGNAIGRILAQPGDKINLKNGIFYRNNEKIAVDREPLNNLGITTTLSGDWTLSPDTYFIYLSAIMTHSISGENRLERSLIPKENIHGKVVLRYAPLDRIYWF